MRALLTRSDPSVPTLAIAESNRKGIFHQQNWAEQQPETGDVTRLCQESEKTGRRVMWREAFWKFSMRFAEVHVCTF